MENKQCEKGLEWCPITKKCIPEQADGKGKGRRMGRGQGKGPIGQPYKEATELVDTILTGDYSTYKILGEVDTILDEVENQIDTVPDQDIDQLQADVIDELSKDSSDVEEEKAEEYKENTIEENMKQSVQLLVTEEDYRTFFKSMLKKYNINSPSDLDDAKKKEFFNVVDRSWKAKKESD